MKKFNLLLCAFALSTLVGQAQLSNLTPKNGAQSENPGTEMNPYLIGNLEELGAFREAVKNDETTDVSFELSASIDVSATNWVAMGVFKGVLDGKGYAIQGLKTGTADSPTSLGKGFGFFTNMDGATVRNLNFTGVAIYGDMSASSGHGYCGVIYGGSKQTVANYLLNCSVEGVVRMKNEVAKAGSSSLHVGGLIGMASVGTKMVNCFADINIETSSAQIANAGGLIGNIDAKSLAEVVNCYARGSISAKGCLRANENNRFFVGGVCGAVSTSGGRLLNSYSAATVEAVSGNTTGTNLLYVGGVAGGCINVTAFEINNCLALGSALKADQTGKKPNIARIIGYTDETNTDGKLKMSDCYANPSMTLTRNGEAFEPSKKGTDQVDGADMDVAFSAVSALNNYVMANPNYEYKAGATVKLLNWKSENGSIVFGETSTALSNEATNEKMKCFVAHGMATFEGVESNATFQLLSLSGQLLANGQLTDGSMALNSKGIYLVQIAGQTFKVAY